MSPKNSGRRACTAPAAVEGNREMKNGPKSVAASISISTTMAPKKGPRFDPNPPMTNMPRKITESFRLKVSEFKWRMLWAASEPAMPAKTAARKNACSLYLKRFMPSSSAARSWSRSAMKARPSLDREMLWAMRVVRISAVSER